MPDAVTASPSISARLSPDQTFIDAFRWMLLARRLEEKLASLYHSGKIVGGVYIGRGQEAFSAAIGISLKRGKDIFGPLIRDMAGRLAFGASVLDPARTSLGSVLGPMRGRDGNVHWGRPREGMPVMISHLGSLVSVVCGMLVARRFRGETGMVGAASIGEGGTSTGAFHEALNLAAIEKLPLVVAVANNQFAYSTPTTSQFACANLADRAPGYGVEGHTVDGTDLGACLDVIGRAVARARAGHGPQLVVGSLLRLSGHGEHDDASYVPAAARASALGRDCLDVARQHLLDLAWSTPAEIQRWDNEATEEVRVAVATAQQEPAPDASRDDWRALSGGVPGSGVPA
jgi:pyruvate dehydrogenase E1 component alpha subunit/2-oxoisovalerate dehydrogenase E1 component alpha subunit